MKCVELNKKCVLQLKLPLFKEGVIIDDLLFEIIDNIISIVLKKDLFYCFEKSSIYSIINKWKLSDVFNLYSSN